MEHPMTPPPTITTSGEGVAVGRPGKERNSSYPSRGTPSRGLEGIAKSLRGIRPAR